MNNNKLFLYIIVFLSLTTCTKKKYPYFDDILLNENNTCKEIDYLAKIKYHSISNIPIYYPIYHISDILIL